MEDYDEKFDGKVSKYTADQLTDAVFGGGMSAAVSNLQRPTESQKALLEDVHVKRGIEKDVFEILAKYEIPRDKAVGAVANFLENLNRIK